MFGYHIVWVRLTASNLYNVNSPKGYQGMTLDYKSRLMRLHANSLELRRLRYDIIYTYKVVFGLVNGAAFDLFTLTSLVYSSGTRGHTYKLFPHCSRVDLYKYFFSHYNKQIKQPTYRTA